MLARWTILILLGILCQPLVGQSTIRWADKSIRSACQIAEKEEKYVFVDTYTTTCLPCKVMDRELLYPELVDYFNQYLVNVKVDMNAKGAQAIKDQYDLVFLPTLMILDPNGKVMYKVDKVIDGPELLYKAKLVLERNLQFDDASSVSYSPVPADQGHRKVNTRPARPGKRPKTTTLPPEKGETAPSDIESDEKILFVLDGKNENVPPEVLRQEAYFRLEFSDGSHRKAATDYLATQQDWSSRDNLRFIYDFLFDAQGQLFDYFVNHQEDFIRLVGPVEVNRTIDILVHQRLTRGFPRPGLEEAKFLYSLLDQESSVEDAYHYTLDVLLSEGRQLTYLELFPQYCSEVGLTNHQRLHEAAQVFVNSGRPKVGASTTDYIAWLEYAISLVPERPRYYETLSRLYLLSGDKATAKEQLATAVEVARQKGIDFTPNKKLAKKVGTL